MAVKDFLSTINWRGRNLGTPGQVGMGLDSMENVWAPMAYAQALLEAERPGGILSDLGVDQVYAGQVESIMAQERGRRQTVSRGLAQSGMNPTSAAQVIGADPLIAQRQRSGLRGTMLKELQENRFGAMQSMANALAASEQQQAQLGYARAGLDAQGRSQMMGGLSSGMSAGLLAALTLGTGGLGTAALMGLGAAGGYGMSRG